MRNIVLMRPFQLAPAMKCAPEKLLSPSEEDRLQIFLLALAVVYNDLKGLQLMHDELQTCKPPPAEISPSSGQWIGLEMQVHRYIVGLMHELLKLLASFEAEVGGPDIARWIKSAHPSVRKRWRNIVSIASGGRGSGDKSFTRVLVMIRNNAVFHYYQPRLLARGYRKHFFEDPPAMYNEHAYVSLGRNMAQTRFFYADAAMQGAMSTIMAEFGEGAFARRVIRLASDINHVLECLLRHHAQASEATAT